MGRKINFLKIFLYLTVFTLSLGQFAVIGKEEGTTIYLFDLLVAGFVFIGIYKYLIKSKDLFIPKNLFFYLGFSFLAVVSLLFRITTLGFDALIIGMFYLARWLIYLFSTIFVINMIKDFSISKSEFYKLIFTSALFISIAGFIQLLVLPDFTVLDSSLGWDPHKNRLASTLFDPNFTGGYLAICIGIAISTIFRTNKTNVDLSKLEVFSYILIPLIALFLTFSRSSWGMFAVIILTVGLFKKGARWLLITAFLVGFLTYFAVPRVQTRIVGITDPADSASLRLVSWKNTFNIAKDNLFLGTGFNTFRHFQKKYGFFDAGEIGGNSGAGSDSSILLVLATTGILGFVLFVIGYLNKCLTLFRRKEYVMLGIFIGLFLHSQFVNSLFYPQIMFLWLILVGFD